MYRPSAYAVLGVTRHLFTVYGDVVSSVGHSVNPHPLQHTAYGSQISYEIYLTLAALDKGILYASAVLIHGAAARKTSYDVDAAARRIGGVHLLVDVLEVAHHYRGTGLPKHEHVLVKDMLGGEVILSRKIQRHVGR